MASSGLYDFDSLITNRILYTYGICRFYFGEPEVSPLILEIIKSIVIPELAKFIQDYYTQHNSWPSKEEMEAKANQLADKIIEQGEAFLKESGE